MLTSRTWIISSGLVGAISLILRFALKLSVTGTSSLSPTFIIHGIIFALAASVSLFGHESDSPATEHHHDDDDRSYSEHDHHHHDNNHNYDHDHNPSSNNSSNSSFDRYNNKVHEKEKFPVGSISSPEVRFPSLPSEKSAGLRRPPTVPLKTFPKDDKSGEVSNDKDETMEELWNRVKAEKHPNNPNMSGISREDTRMSTSSSSSPSRARYPSSSSPSPSRARYPPWSSPSPSRARNPPSSPAQPGTKLMERMPSWLKLKKELSMGREELNSRVEAFITKFNDEMKLQRLESIRRYKLFRRRSDEK